MKRYIIRHWNKYPDVWVELFPIIVKFDAPELARSDSAPSRVEFDVPDSWDCEVSARRYSTVITFTSPLDATPHRTVWSLK